MPPWLSKRRRKWKCSLLPFLSICTRLSRNHIPLKMKREIDYSRLPRDLLLKMPNSESSHSSPAILTILFRLNGMICAKIGSIDGKFMWDIRKQQQLCLWISISGAVKCRLAMKIFSTTHIKLHSSSHMKMIATTSNLSQDYFKEWITCLYQNNS